MDYATFAHSFRSELGQYRTLPPDHLLERYLRSLYHRLHHQPDEELRHSIHSTVYAFFLGSAYGKEDAGPHSTKEAFSPLEQKIRRT